MIRQKQPAAEGPRRLAVVTRTVPHDGGLHTYSRMALDALTRQVPAECSVGVFSDQRWWSTDPDSEPYRGVVMGTFPQRRQGGVLGRLGAQRPWQSAIVRPLFRRLNPLPRAVDAWRPQIVFYPAHSYLTLWHRRPVAVAVHDLMHLYEKEFPEACAPAEVRGREVQYAQIAARASRILVDSELGGEMYLESYRRFGAHRAQVRVVPYAAPSEFVRDPDPADRLSGWGLPSRYLVYPAQFWLHKNHLRLLRALRAARRSVPDMHLVLVGSPRNASAAVHELIASPDMEGAVTHLGFVTTPELVSLYSGAHGLVYPSLFGPTNVPPLEAIACGCPPAVADVYAARAQLGESALYFEGRSVESIADAMVKLWTDAPLRSRLLEAGARRMEGKPIERFGRGLLEALL